MDSEIVAFIVNLLYISIQKLKKALMVEIELILFGFKNSVFSFAFPNIGWNPIIE